MHASYSGQTMAENVGNADDDDDDNNDDGNNDDNHNNGADDDNDDNDENKYVLHPLVEVRTARRHQAPCAAHQLHSSVYPVRAAQMLP